MRHSFEVFTQEPTGYLNTKKLYYSYFSKIPEIRFLRGIDCSRAIKLFKKSYSDEVKEQFAKEGYSKTLAKPYFTEYFFVLKQELIIHFTNENSVYAYYSTKSREKVAQIFGTLKRAIKKALHSRIHLVVSKYGELDLTPIKLKKPQLSLEENYNDELLSLHDELSIELRKKNNSGLILFHGKPGTGKSTYLRYLSQSIKGKTIIYLPSKLAKNLDSPLLTNLLLANKNSILIIEDAEEIILSRNTGNDSSTSMLLNLTNGLLGEGLGTQVICTFNTAISNIDEALLRKGRLMALYEFDALSVPKTQKLLQRLNQTEHVVTHPMTLAEIYNLNKQHFGAKAQNVKAIGFLN